MQRKGIEFCFRDLENYPGLEEEECVIGFAFVAGAWKLRFQMYAHFKLQDFNPGF